MTAFIGRREFVTLLGGRRPRGRWRRGQQAGRIMKLSL